ncbi:AzlC family ABC transporter permease [Desulfocurvus sp.]|jgi:4-azaleucine resistance transporter AzlC|uniref:AzlC family ABC transporter permease n=1 Tax=Desulfocurvus sp. TaxID=2871698 RepID=UPI0025B8296B|nr:AzlC family ABC transporter permease [Desulfocurvus sp.]MCK9241433.1 AzlC family ABC transporter permease [Desulfocurvus sp.]
MDVRTSALDGARWAPGAFGEALRQAAPIVLGYLPVGFAYGVLALKTGLSPLNAVLMSALVFAGSAQLIAVGLLAAGASPLSVAATTFVVNLRHLLMAASLAPHLRGWPASRLAWFGFQLTDETFALHSLRFMQGPPRVAQTLWINAVAHGAWVAGSALGVAASAAVADVRPLGLDYALPAMFIALVVGQVRGAVHVLVGLAAAGLALGLHAAGAGPWSVILATLGAAALGTGVSAWTRR